MGLTWITGVLVFDDVLIPFAYLFTIFVALQVLFKKIVKNNSTRCAKKILIYSSPLTGLGHIHPVCDHVKTGTLATPDSITLVSDLHAL
jgi:hypothetical protein